MLALRRDRASDLSQEQGIVKVWRDNAPHARGASQFAQATKKGPR
jgi:hypothetical protein